MSMHAARACRIDSPIMLPDRSITSVMSLAIAADAGSSGAASVSVK